MAQVPHPIPMWCLVFAAEVKNTFQTYVINNLTCGGSFYLTWASKSSFQYHPVGEVANDGCSGVNGFQRRQRFYDDKRLAQSEVRTVGAEISSQFRESHRWSIVSVGDIDDKRRCVCKKCDRKQRYSMLWPHRRHRKGFQKCDTHWHAFRTLHQFTTHKACTRAPPTIILILVPLMPLHRLFRQLF